MIREVDNGCDIIYRKSEEKKFIFEDKYLLYTIDDNHDDYENLGKLVIIVKENTDDENINELTNFIVISCEKFSRLIVTINKEYLNDENLFINFINNILKNYDFKTISFFTLNNSVEIVNYIKYLNNLNEIFGVLIFNPYDYNHFKNLELPENIKKIVLKSDEFEINSYYYSNIYLELFKLL